MNIAKFVVLILILFVLLYIANEMRLIGISFDTLNKMQNERSVGDKVFEKLHNYTEKRADKIEKGFEKFSGFFGKQTADLK